MQLKVDSVAQTLPQENAQLKSVLEQYEEQVKEEEK